MEMASIVGRRLGGLLRGRRFMLVGGFVQRHAFCALAPRLAPQAGTMPARRQTPSPPLPTDHCQLTTNHSRRQAFWTLAPRLAPQAGTIPARRQTLNPPLPTSHFPATASRSLCSAGYRWVFCLIRCRWGWCRQRSRSSADRTCCQPRRPGSPASCAGAPWCRR